MGTKVRVVQVGLGGMGKTWLKVLSQYPDVELVGVVDLRREAALEAARSVGLPEDRAGSDLKAFLAAHKPEVVVDVTIPAAHKEVTLTALAAGCHVLGEKPLADTLANARVMVAEAARAGKLYMVSQNRRWNPQVRAIRAALAEGLLGQVTTVNTDFYLGAHFGGFRDQMDHPLLLDMAIHHFDMMRCMTGANAEAVYACAFNPKGSWYKGEPAATVLFEASGAIVYTYRGSWCAEGHTTGWEGVWRIVGEKGSLLWDGVNAPVAEVAAPAPGQFKYPVERRELPVPAGAAGQAESLRIFLAALASGRQPECAGADNIHSLAMVFGAIESARLRARVRIET